jgi:nucleotide-binding universal stress UspA family protein
MNDEAGRIVVGLDGSIPSAAALDWAAAESERRHLPLTILYLVDQLALITSNAESSSDARRDSALHIDRRLTRRGSAGCRLSRTRRRNRARLGSVGFAVSAQAHCPIVVVQPPPPTSHWTCIPHWWPTSG